MMEKNVKVKARKKARQLIMQALYQWSMTEVDLYPLQMQFHQMNDMAKVDKDYFDALLYAIIKNLEEIDSKFTPYLDRKFEDLNPVELAVIRLGTYELLHCLEIPYRVVLFEAVSLTKEYGSEDGYKYVNGILNKVAREMRKAEVEAEGNVN